MVSDVGARHEGLARPDVDVRRQSFHRRAAARLQRQLLAPGARRSATRPTCLFEVTLPNRQADDVSAVALRRSGGGRRSGGYSLQEPVRQLLGYLYTDKPIYRPGHTVHVKAVMRWRHTMLCAPFDRPNAESWRVDPNDKVVFRAVGQARCFGAVTPRSLSPPLRHLALTRIRVAAATPSQRALRSAGIPATRVRSDRDAGGPLRRSGRDVVVDVQARYYFGQPVANALGPLVVNGRRITRLFAGTTARGRRGRSTCTAAIRMPKARSGSTPRARRNPIAARAPTKSGRDYTCVIEAQVMDASSREVSGSTVVHATYRHFHGLGSSHRLHLPALQPFDDFDSRDRLPRAHRKRTCR